MDRTDLRQAAGQMLVAGFDGHELPHYVADDLAQALTGRKGKIAFLLSPWMTNEDAAIALRVGEGLTHRHRVGGHLGRLSEGEHQHGRAQQREHRDDLRAGSEAARALARSVCGGAGLDREIADGRVGWFEAGRVSGGAHLTGVWGRLPSRARVGAWLVDPALVSALAAEGLMQAPHTTSTNPGGLAQPSSSGR